MSEFAISGNGRLQSRIFQWQAGSAAAGKFVDHLAINTWGPILSYDYNGNGIATDDVFNITSGGTGTKAVTTAWVAAPWTYFALSNPVYVGESSYFFGLLSDAAPVLRTMWVHTDNGWVSVTGYAPPLP